ncbi:MAG TPA: C25 family cysteine peptidase [Kofleriaceae bacterium]|nr:C25 family cysteine peptidase [Kofleriaceae bacterium]
MVDHPYRLRVQITRKARAGTWAQAVFPEAVLRETLARLGSVELTVTIHPLVGKIQLSSATGTLRLPALGDSDTLALDLVVASAGAFSLRVCIYYGTVLLQSVAFEGAAGQHAAEPGTVRSTLDYAASADFMSLGQHEQPDVTIWSNQAADGTHWFGVFTGGATQSCLGLTNGGLQPLTTGDLESVAGSLRDALTSVLMRPAQAKPDPRHASTKQGRAYRFDPPVPADDAERGERLQQLVSLALAGWDAYNGLFPGLTSTQSPAASAVGGLLAIARCHPERVNIAWAALYDYHLSKDPAPSACEVFAEQLRTGQDLLDRPQDCRARPGCPLGDVRRRDRTVCPFGFWGLRHRIEQPPHHIAPPAEGQIKDEMDVERASGLKTAITRPGGNPVRLGIAWWPHFDERVKHHLEMLDELGAAERESDRDRILALLARGQKQIYYFFCHGEGENLTFELIVGPGEHDAITVGDLNDDRYTWSADGPAPLVFLNGCDTTAFRGDTINKFLTRFRAMGASGVIGTEIPVHTYLAEDVGKRVLAALAAGHPLGNAFLALRRDLLRTQINPLGLAYSFFASARLHVCEGAACHVCTP